MEGSPHATHRFVGFSLFMSSHNLSLVFEGGSLMLGEDMSRLGVVTHTVDIQ